MDISDLYDLIFKFDERIDSSFQRTEAEFDTLRSRLARRGQEIANLEGGYDFLEKEVEALKGRLDERDEAIAELRRAVDFLTNKRSLGTRAQIPTGHMVKTLRSQSTCDSNMPSDQMLSTF